MLIVSPLLLFLPLPVSCDLLVGGLADGLGQEAGDHDPDQVDPRDAQDPDTELGQVVDDEVDDETVAALELF